MWRTGVGINSTFGLKKKKKHMSACAGKALTVGVVAESSIREDAGFLLRLLGHVDGQVQVLNPLPHLHFRAKNHRTNNKKHVPVQLENYHFGKGTVICLVSDLHKSTSDSSSLSQELLSENFH